MPKSFQHRASPNHSHGAAARGGVARFCSSASGYMQKLSAPMSRRIAEQETQRIGHSRVDVASGSPSSGVAFAAADVYAQILLRAGA